MVGTQRIIAIICAYLVSWFVATIVALVAFATAAGMPLHFDTFMVNLTAAAVYYIVPGATVALVPALMAVFYLERKRVRSPLFYSCAGAMAGLAILGFYDWMGSADAAFSAQVISVVGSAGVLAGLSYWAIAGRNAGRG